MTALLVLWQRSIRRRIRERKQLHAHMLVLFALAFVPPWFIKQTHALFGLLYFTSLVHVHFLSSLIILQRSLLPLDSALHLKHLVPGLSAVCQFSSITSHLNSNPTLRHVERARTNRRPKHPELRHVFFFKQHIPHRRTHREPTRANRRQHTTPPHRIHSLRHTNITILLL